MFWPFRRKKPAPITSAVPYRAVVTQEALELIKSFEGCELTPYKCSANVPTVGYGATTGLDGLAVVLGSPAITKMEADTLFARDIARFSESVRSLVKVEVNSNQFSALVSLAYNIGSGNLKKSTLLKKLNKGDYKGAADEFPKWRRARGKVLQGLVRRRELERNLFLS